jgi:hypothetical protein
MGCRTLPEGRVRFEPRTSLRVGCRILRGAKGGSVDFPQLKPVRPSTKKAADSSAASSSMNRLSLPAVVVAIIVADIPVIVPNVATVVIDVGFVAAYRLPVVPPFIPPQLVVILSHVNAVLPNITAITVDVTPIALRERERRSHQSEHQNQSRPFRHLHHIFPSVYRFVILRLIIETALEPGSFEEDDEYTFIYETVTKSITDKRDFTKDNGYAPPLQGRGVKKNQLRKGVPPRLSKRPDRLSALAYIAGSGLLLGARISSRRSGVPSTRCNEGMRKPLKYGSEMLV